MRRVRLNKTKVVKSKVVERGGTPAGSILDRDKQIHTRAMLVKVTLHTWSARRFDRKVSDEVNARHAAGRDAGRYNKHLLGGKEAARKHADVINAAMTARTLCYEQTLPWADEGWRLLPVANYDEFTNKMRAATSAFQDAAHEFVAEYPTLREQARALLGDLYNDADYPTPVEVAAKFGASVQFTPLPAAGDFRLDLPAEQLAGLEDSTTQRVQQAVAEAMTDAWQRLHDVVDRVRERLSDPDAIFRDSLIDNVADMVDILQRLNVTGDPELESMRERVREQLADLNPDDLRKDKKARKAAAKQANDILRAMSGALRKEV